MIYITNITTLVTITHKVVKFGMFLGIFGNITGYS